MNHNRGNSIEDIGGVNGTVTSATLTSNCKIGQGYTYDGNNDKIEGGVVASIQGVNPKSIFVWFKENTGGGNQYIFGFNQPGNGLAFHVYYASGTTCKLDTGGDTVSCVTNLNRGIYQSICGYTDCTNNLIFQNGEFEATHLNANAINTSATSYDVGCAVGGGGWAKGIIDEIMLFKKVLTRNEIKALDNLGY